MKRKFLCTLLSVAMTAVMLSGCGGKTTTTDATTKQETTQETNTDTATDTKSEDTNAAGDTIVVGFSQVGAESDWRTANTESMKTTFTEENGYTLLFDDAQQKQENQIKAVRNFIQQDVDYIVIAPVTETGWDTVLKEAKDAGIPVIIVDRMVDVSDDSLYEAWVGSNFLQEGYDAADWLAEYLDKQQRSAEDINIVTLQGTIGASAQIGRTDGVEEKMKEHTNWTMLERQTGEFTQAKGQEVMESFLKSYDDIDVVIAENDNMAFGAIDAIKAAGKTCGPNGDIIILSFDAVAAAFDSMIAGDMNVSIECNPLHGPRVAELIQKLEKGETVDKIAYVEEGIFPADTAAEIKPTRAY
ncbi:monosaccharide ABC transporter substrate-binding protein (CUT2 family) [Lachnotalea glycerini]|jgi:galactofuranose transport system substrate-binding protein|uniref:LacI family transcriptional regulator n=1 Tax=Lachnotalea glycerini TaxID=1763509 RepID=A0A255IK29_9FIRM|nr:ABC transporter substrate-binding protein [Lachnotalea glycerini]PXV89530.1 monosaccharide ABC transporter substrate-binding protein (CUT2 family) [Lachnotalea glycerini]RDY32290.1 LacI family transcriptional regulator [Lachnotalea glycerini]